MNLNGSIAVQQNRLTMLIKEICHQLEGHIIIKQWQGKHLYLKREILLLIEATNTVKKDNMVVLLITNNRNNRN